MSGVSLILQLHVGAGTSDSCLAKVPHAPSESHAHHTSWSNTGHFTWLVLFILCLGGASVHGSVGTGDAGLVDVKYDLLKTFEV